MPLTRLMPLAAVLLLTACGGGGGGPTTEFNYQPIDSTVPGESTVRLVGPSRSGGNPIDGTVNARGTLDRPSQSLNIAGVIADPNGRSGDTWSDGTTTVSLASVAEFGGQYDFFVPVEVSRAGQSDIFLLGVASRAQDLPSSGSATYTGQASVGGILTGGGAGSTDFAGAGEGRLNVDFGSNEAELVMSALTGSGIPFDFVRVSNIAVTNGSGDAVFSSTGGSTFEMRDGNTVVRPVGTPTEQQLAGTFFGGDANGPLEAGATMYIEGPDGQIWGLFAAEGRTLN